MWASEYIPTLFKFCDLPKVIIDWIISGQLLVWLGGVAVQYEISTGCSYSYYNQL